MAADIRIEMATKTKSEQLEQRIRQLEGKNAELKRLSAATHAGNCGDEDLMVFKQAVEASSDAVGMSTAKGRHYYQNKSFDDLFGDIGNDPPSTLYVDASVGREVFAAIMGGQPWNGEVNMYGRDGRILNILLRAYPVKDDKGIVRRIVGVHTNITERKKAEDELRLHREHLEKLVEERTIKLTESEEALHRSREKLRNLSGYLQRAFEEERKRIAREIHDDLGQTLIAMKMSLAALRKKFPGHNGLLTETVASAEETIDRMIQSIRIMISDFRAGPLSDLGLEAAIEWFTENLMKQNRINIKINIDVDDFKIDPDRELALFRITQEALTNIVRHSGATEVSINLSATDDNAELTIKDNGSGMENADEPPAGAYGIMGMRERIRFFNGHLAITSDAVNGTALTATIPLGNSDH